MTETSAPAAPLDWIKGASAGRWTADTDERGGTRYLAVRDGKDWSLRVHRTETVAGVTVAADPSRPLADTRCDSLREAKAVAAEYDRLRGVSSNRLGTALTAAYAALDA